MNTSFFIAKRYFFSKKKKNFINIISLLSMTGVAGATIALVAALSVFNGLEGLIRNIYYTFDAEIRVTALKGKSFEVNEPFLDSISSVEGVAVITEVIEDNALLKYRDRQMVVNLKGVSDNFSYQNHLDSMIVEGDYVLHKKGINYAIIGRGVQYLLSVSLDDGLYPLQFWYPKTKKALSLNPEKAFNRKNIWAGAAFAIEKQYDDSYVFVPLDFTKQLFEYDNKRTSLEIKTKSYFQIDKVKKAIQEKLGNKYLVQNSDEQHASLLRAIKIEKFFVTLTLSVILALASVGIFFSLTMLVIEKKKDVAILFAMGAPVKFIKKIFFIEGIIIGLTGAGLGLILGFMLCWAQQTFGIVSMGMKTSIVDAYPVKMQLADFIYTGITIFIITLIVSYGPAIRAAKIDISSNLY
ncbi:MAG: ABC transporter permease [Bacteroidetes bacterium]|nr:ABC transporter permease [Bacteroidota bacterium]